MPKKLKIVDKSVLINATLPPATSSYTVISHQFVIDTVIQELTNHNMIIKKELYKCSVDGNVAYGIFVIEDSTDPELSLVYSFTNSYDKTLRLKLAVGGQVKANKSFVIGNTFVWKRKHTGTADTEAAVCIADHIKEVSDYFDLLVENKEAMKAIHITTDQFGQCIGELFINNWLSVDQMSAIQKEFEKPSVTYPNPSDCLWTYYCYITHALKMSHPSKWMLQQSMVHLFFLSKYDILNPTVIDNTDDDESEDDENIPLRSSPLRDEDWEDEPDTEESEENNNEQTETEPTETEQPEVVTIQGEVVPVIPGILDGVETVKPTILPGFGTPNITKVETKPTEEPIITNQIDLEDAIADAEAEQQLNPEPTASEEIETEVEEPVPMTTEETSISNEGTEQLQIEPIDATVSETLIPTDNVLHLPVEDFEDMKLGDIFEDENGEMFNVIDKIDVEGSEYFVCTLLETSTEQPPETNIVIEETISHTEESPTLSGSDFDIDPIREHVEQPLIPDATPEPTEPVADNIPENILGIIATELEEIYGSAQDFECTDTGEQYNIVLESGESLTLTKTYIEMLLTQ